jgi:hypothetical protein
VFFLAVFFFGFHRSLRGNGGAFCAEYLVIHVVNVNFTHSLTLFDGSKWYNQSINQNAETSYDARHKPGQA